MTGLENRPPRVALRPALAKKPSRVTLRDSVHNMKPKPKPLDQGKSSGNIVRRPAPGPSQPPQVTLPQTPPTKSFLLQPARPAWAYPNPSAIAKKVERVTPPGAPKVSKKEPPPPSDHDADDEESDDLESRIRADLTSPSSLRRAQTPSSIKSVRWDPSIISYGRVTAGSDVPSEYTELPSPSPKPRNGVADALRSLSRLKKEDQATLCRLLRALTDSDDEAANTPCLQRLETKSAMSNFSERPPSQSASNQANFADRKITKNTSAVSTGNPFKRPAQKRPVEIEKPIDTELAESNFKAESKLNPMKKLNPKAPIFGNFSQTKQVFQENNKRNIKEKDVQQSVATPHRKDFREPIWVNIFNPPTTSNMLPGLSGLDEPQHDIIAEDPPFLKQPPNLPAGQPMLPIFSLDQNQHVAQFPLSQQMIPPTLIPIGFPGVSGNCPPPIWLPMPILQSGLGLESLPQQALWVNPLGFQAPLFNKPAPQTARQPPFRPRPKGPVIDVSSSYIPPDDGKGREAQAGVIDQAWGKSLLNSFCAKYPQTGKINNKAKIQAPGQMRQAAAIQQDLEFLIYQEKEKSAWEERQGMARVSNKGSSSTVEENRREQSSSTGTVVKNWG